MILPRLKIFKLRGANVVIGLAVLYLVFSIGYSFLPWSVRREVYNRSPKLDRVLRETGYNVMQGWDELALTGHDASVDFRGTYRGEPIYAGYPAQGFKLLGRVQVLENRGYTVGYSESMKNPLWVCYRIFDVPKLQSGKRPSRFKTDKRTRTEVSHDDYTNSGFDRGHMAPNYGIATRYGRDAQLDTFLMSNVIPQSPGVNRHMWKDLELRVARRYGRYFSEVWVITGPVFQGETHKLKSGVPIPSAYYKIILDENGGELRALAFLVERDCPPYTRIRTCLVSIDDIEAVTDLDFFSDLPDDVESRLESMRATRLWPWIPASFRYHTSGRKQ